MTASRLIIVALGCAALLEQALTSAHAAGTQAATVAVAPQYDTTHVYVAPEDVDRFCSSFLATFGGHSTKPNIATVTPTPSSTTTQLLQTPVGLVSLFGFRTPIPYPFGSERTGYLVSDLDVALSAARAAGADVLVGAFSDPIGRDAVIQWPGGINMQLYVHTAKSSYGPLQTIPDNRIYLSPGSVATFMRSFLRFSGGKVISDDSNAAGSEIGRSGEIYRRIRIESAFGNMMILVTDGHLPYPYGRETTGYAVSNLVQTLERGDAAGVTVLVSPQPERQSAIVQFPGGYIAEIHAVARK